MDRKHDLLAFTAILVGIGVVYDKEIAEQLIDIYWQALKRFDLNEVKQAVEKHINDPDSGQYFPKPAALIKLIVGSSQQQALQAWSKVYKAILAIGAYQSVVFDDYLIHAILGDMGGWVNLCLTSLKDLPFKAQEFQKRYMMLLNKAPTSYPKYCCGINLQADYVSLEPLLIGDLDKATEVMQKGSFADLAINTKNAVSIK